MFMGKKRLILEALPLKKLSESKYLTHWGTVHCFCLLFLSSAASVTSLKYTHTQTQHGAGYHGNQEPDLFASFRPLTRVKTCSFQPQTGALAQI